MTGKKQLHAIMAVTYVAEVRSDTHIDVNKFIFVWCTAGMALPAQTLMPCSGKERQDVTQQMHDCC